MNKVEQERLEREFARLSAESDSEEAQARVGVKARKNLTEAAREHARFLARSKAYMWCRVVV
jgi:cell division protein FtsL